MAQAVYINGCTLNIDHTPAGAISAGDVVVQGSSPDALVGVASAAIAASALGSLQINGVFDFTKPAGVTYAVGDKLYWDDTNNRTTTTAASNHFLGRCVAAAASADVLVRCLLCPTTA